MSMPTLLELAESGAHFGHHKSLIFPRAKEFIYGLKKSVALINLELTQQKLLEAQRVYQETKASGKTVLLVGTKRSIKGVIERLAEREGIAYISERWLGGFLTNFESFHKNIERMNKLAEYLASDEAKTLSKIERLRESNKLAKTERFLKGVAKLKAMPDLIILASATQDKIAVREANQMNVPLIAIADTDMDPELITYPIPANDDAPKAVELIITALVSENTINKAKITKIKTEVAKQTEKQKGTKKPTSTPRVSKAKKVSEPKKKAEKKSAVNHKTPAKKTTKSKK